MKRERVVVVYPFLIAIYSVLALAAKNAAEVSPRDLQTPLVVSLSVVTVAWLMGCAFSRNYHMIGLAALSVTLWFSWYGFADRYFDAFASGHAISLPSVAVPLSLILLILVSLFVARRFKSALVSVTRFLNVSGGILVIICVVRLLGAWLASSPPPAIPTTPFSPRRALDGTVNLMPHGAPDIYLLVLDEYTGSRALEANLGFDNRPFEDSLRQEGFIVPRSPRSNYVQTHLVLAAMLNWRLLDGLSADTKPAEALRRDFTAIEESQTWAYVRDLGYRLIFLPSAYPGTRANHHADLQLPEPADVGSLFANAWLRGTVLLTVAQAACVASRCSGDRHMYVPEPASLLDWKFEELRQLADTSGPKFVFAHLLVPHEPFIYNADCSHREPLWPTTRHDKNDPEARTAYVNQIRCVNAKLLTVTRAIIARSQSPPIVILQADHGNGRLDASLGSADEAGAARVAERVEPFAAYYLPGNPSGVVYDSITPVNVLPRIFNYYFGAGIPLQPDETYWSSALRPFDFTKVR